MDESVHRISQSYKDSLVSSFGVAGLLATGFGVLVWFTPEFHGFPLLWLVVFFYLFIGGLLAWSFLILKQTQYYIVTGPDGISRIEESKAPFLVSWSDIVRTEDRIWSRCTKLFGVGDRFLMNLDWQLENFDKLKKLVQQKVSLERGGHVAAKQFHLIRRRNWVDGFVIAVFTWFAVLSALQSAYLPCMLFVVGAGGYLFTWMRSIRAITIKSEGLELRRILKTQVISWNEVDKIDLNSISDQSGGVYHIVNIQLKARQSIKMPAVQEGNLLLYDALTYHLKQNQHPL